jgi:rubrerythrin
MQENPIEVNYDEELLVAQRVNPNLETPIVEQVLRISVYDEYQAYETYRAIIEKFGNQAPFSNIIEAEIRHFSMLEPLLQKYNVSTPINNWDTKIKLPETLLESCEVGVAGEIQNIQMYDDLLMYVDNYPDIQDAFYRLQAASFNNHLPAFRRCVQQYSTEQMETSMQDSAPLNPNIPAPDNAEMMNKVNDFRNIATKLSSGKLSQQDMVKVFSSMNMATMGGLLMGGLGAVQLLKALDKGKESEKA